MKSDGAIRTDIYKYINTSGFMGKLSGRLTKNKRPHNSRKEDVIISVIANEGTQAQTAILNVNIYVQDFNIDNQFEENNKRVDDLCEKSWKLLECFRTDEYCVHAISQRVYAVDTGEHMINNQIEYKLIND